MDIKQGEVKRLRQALMVGFCNEEFCAGPRMLRSKFCNKHQTKRQRETDMTQGKQRKNIYITMDRVALLAKGKDVFLTQDGQPYRMIPQLNCCPEMAQLRKTPAGEACLRVFSVPVL